MIPMPANVVPTLPTGAATLPSGTTAQTKPAAPPFHETYAGAALSGALGTGLLGALVGVLAGVGVRNGAQYGAAFGAAAGAYREYVRRATGDRSSPRLYRTRATR